MPIHLKSDINKISMVLNACAELEPYTIQELQRSQDPRTNMYRCLQLLQELSLRAKAQKAEGEA